MIVGACVRITVNVNFHDDLFAQVLFFMTSSFVETMSSLIFWDLEITHGK